MFYKYGGKQLYYFNTHDGQGELDVSKLVGEAEVPQTNGYHIEDDEEACESCVI
jgi:hypothetical protein